MSDQRPFKITDARGGTAIPVRVTTGAERPEISGKEDGMLRVRLTAASASGAANQELRTLLASLLNVADSAIAIVAGEGARDKIVSVDDLSSAEVEERLGIAD
jgi:uncharacterized protein YggU (UPF0235/DUF167 family)